MVKRLTCQIKPVPFLVGAKWVILRSYPTRWELIDGLYRIQRRHQAYGEGDARIHALDGASFTVERGELAIILGASGAGKTTALNILGGMDTVPPAL